MGSNQYIFLPGKYVRSQI